MPRIFLQSVSMSPRVLFLRAAAARHGSELRIYWNSKMPVLPELDLRVREYLLLEPSRSPHESSILVGLATGNLVVMASFLAPREAFLISFGRS